MQWALPTRLGEEPHGEPCVPGAEQVQAFVAVGCAGFFVSVPEILASPLWDGGVSWNGERP